MTEHAQDWNPFKEPHPALRSWAQLMVSLAIMISGFVWGASKFESNQEQVQKAVDQLAEKMDKFSNSVTRLAAANERLDEHIRAVDHRLDQLEKFEEWKRPR